MKRKGLITAATIFILTCMVSGAAGQALPSQPGTPDYPGAPGVPGAPGQPGVPGQPGLPGQMISTGAADATRFKITPFVRVTEQYTSNMFLTEFDKKDDWITSVYPGLMITANEARYGIDLAGSVGYNWYANDTRDDYWGANGLLNLRFSPDPRLTFRVRDYVERTKNSVAPAWEAGQTGYMVGAYRGDAPYLRNVVEPSVAWEFARESSVGLYYRNSILRYEDEDGVSRYDDYTENYVRPHITYWFNQSNGITLDYGYTSGDYSRDGGALTPDFTAQRAHARYTYRFNPRTSAFLDYIYDYWDNDEPANDYQVNNPSVGVQYAFNPNLIGVAQIGYFWMNPERVNGESGVTSNLSLTQRVGQTTYALAFSNGYQQTTFNFENFGFNKYYMGSASITHLLTQRLSVSLYAAAEYLEYVFVDRTDWLYWVDATATYRLLKWLTVGAGVGYQKDDSNLVGASYDEWHAFLSLTASYDVF